MLKGLIANLPMAWSVIALIVLFIILGVAADKVIDRVKSLSVKLGLPVFILGFILGILTSFPEMAVAISSINNKALDLSMGNLLGGTIVILSLMLGLSVLINRSIDNDGEYGFLALALAYMLIPAILALKGGLGMLDGLIIIALFVLLMWRLYQGSSRSVKFRLTSLKESETMKELLIVIVGMIVVVVTADAIVELTLNALSSYSVSPYLIGLIFFPIGTNLPELTVAFASFKKKAGELSFSNLLSSALFNSLILGIVAFTQTVKLEVTGPHLVTLLTMLVLFSLVLIFYKSGKRLSRWEGAILILVYLIFIILQTGFL